MSPFTLFHIDMATLNIQSPAFAHNGYIPAKYTCDGAGVNPPLTFSDIPEKAQTLVLIIEDPDAPHGTFDHWLLWNIAPTNAIDENSAPGEQGLNSRQQSGYTGPCPPQGVHHYHFKLFALDLTLDLPGGVDKHTLLKAMDGHVIGTGELIGLYKRQ